MPATSTSSPTSAATKLDVSSREASGSRQARRLRRAGRVPGILYGGDGGPVSFAVEARELRLALAAGSAVLDLSIDGARPSPVVLKDIQRHPVRGETVHVDFLRVRLDRPIHAVVVLELHGAENSPGVKEGGILEQITRELNVEALPTAIPPAIVHEVADMQIGDTLVLAAVSAPEGVTLLDDAEETVVATLTPPRLQAEAEAEMEAETELVGEEGAPEEAAEAGAAEEAEAGGAGEGASEE
jgi:large subunit ribosomal protein L25